MLFHVPDVDRRSTSSRACSTRRPARGGDELPRSSAASCRALARTSAIASARSAARTASVAARSPLRDDVDDVSTPAVRSSSTTRRARALATSTRRSPRLVAAADRSRTSRSPHASRGARRRSSSPEQGIVIRAAELIERKRNGEELSDEEIAELVLGYTRGDVPDYQMAAWCMAVYFKGLSGRETHALTDAMIRSGETLDLARGARPTRRRQALDGRRRGQDLARGRADRRRVRRPASGRCAGAGSATRAARSTSSSRSRASASS